MNLFIWPSLVTIFSLLLYFICQLNVGRARFQYQVSPPAMSGSPEFERVLRVQENMTEQLLLFLPALWLFSQYVSPVGGGILGAIWILGRILYTWGYYQAAEKRGPGFGISSLATLVLLGGSGYGIISQFFMAGIVVARP